jgi:hypothetical protein
MVFGLCSQRLVGALDAIQTILPNPLATLKAATLETLVRVLMFASTTCGRLLIA